MNARRPGIALVITIIILLLIEVMSAGMLAMATQSRLLVDSQMRTARADASAMAAAQTVLANWESAGFDTLETGVRVSVPAGSGSRADALWSAWVQRLGPAMWMIRTKSRVGDGHAYSLGRAVAIARTLDAAAAQSDPPTDSIPLGGLTWEQLRDIADRIANGQVVLADTTDYVPLTFAPANLTISGVARGILIVKGTLTIASGAVFEGLIVAMGDVVIENGSVVVGEVRSVSGDVQGDGAAVYVSGSVVSAALAAAPARLRVVSEVRRFLPAFPVPERSSQVPLS
jgi:hypothetical protein